MAMVRIDRLRIRLPAGYEGRAKAILGQIGEQLGGIDLPAGRHDRITVGPLTVGSGLSDRQIAARVCEAIRHCLERLE